MATESKSLHSNTSINIYAVDDAACNVQALRSCADSAAIADLVAASGGGLTAAFLTLLSVK